MKVPRIEPAISWLVVRTNNHSANETVVIIIIITIIIIIIIIMCLNSTLAIYA